MWCSMPTKTGTIPSSFLFAQGEGEDNVGLDSNVMATRTAETKKGTVKINPAISCRIVPLPTSLFLGF